MSDEAKNLLPWHAQGLTLRDADGKAIGYFDHPSGAEEAAKYAAACARMNLENLTPEGYHRLALALRAARVAIVDIAEGLAVNGMTYSGAAAKLAREAIEAIDREHDIATGRAAEFHPPTAFGGIGGA